MLEISAHVAIADAELELAFVRSSGPGGQNVNKVNSKVYLKWHVMSSAIPHAVKLRFMEKYQSKITTDGYVVITSDKTRDQERNIDDAQQKLVAMVSAVLNPPKARKKTKPTLGSKERRVTSKKMRGDVKKMRKVSHHED